MYRSQGNKGKGLTEVGVRQRRRKLNNIKTSVKEVLQFTELYNLDLYLISFVSKDATKELVIIKYSTPTSTQDTSMHSASMTSISTSEQSLISYSTSDASSSNSTSVPDILYFLDSYGVSDNFNHELTMLYCHTK